MADLDVKYDITPLQTLEPARGPSIADLTTALQDEDSDTYTDAVILAMTKTDLIFAAKSLGLSVTGM